MEDNNNSFLDKNTLLAVGLSILFFVGWQQYVQNKYPEVKDDTKQQSAELSAQTNTKEQDAPPMNQEDSLVEETQAVSGATTKKKEAQFFEVNFDNYKATLSTIGMGLSSFQLKNYTDRDNNRILFDGGVSQAGTLATFYKEQPLYFNIEKEAANIFVGTAKAGNQTLIKRLVFNENNYTVEVSLRTQSGKPNSDEVFQTLLVNRIIQGESSMLMPAYEGTEFFVMHDDTDSRERLNPENAMSEKYKKTRLISVGSQYFAVALRDESQTIPNSRVQFEAMDKYAYGWLTHSAKTNGTQTDIKMTAFLGPKKYDLLKDIHNDFALMINYGIFSVLSKPMLSMLKWLYSLFHNWGLAIILLTVLIRMILLPINISSLKSMKKMQKIQPQLKALKEKFKEDPQRMNQETMALMKREKANPIGGCLPMLLQLPVFFALYSVLGQSVELYKSPFIFWIQDLSYKDPFFVLPIAVGGLYFIQMSITPQTMDPAQAKVMKFIPIVFSFFMIAVPSGLTLYFFVNTVFGIGQQFIFQREKRKAAA